MKCSPKIFDSIKDMNIETLSYNTFSSIKEFPSWIGLAKSLKELNISLTQVSSIPESVLELTNLKKLDVSYTQINENDIVLQKLKNKGVEVLSLKVHG